MKVESKWIKWMKADEREWKWMKVYKMDDHGWKWAKVDKINESGWKYLRCISAVFCFTTFELPTSTRRYCHHMFATSTHQYINTNIHQYTNIATKGFPHGSSSGFPHGSSPFSSPSAVQLFKIARPSQCSVWRETGPWRRRKFSRDFTDATLTNTSATPTLRFLSNKLLIRVCRLHWGRMRRWRSFKISLQIILQILQKDQYCKILQNISDSIISMCLLDLSPLSQPPSISSPRLSGFGSSDFHHSMI